ncbi:hypothetical protein B0O99DRAFT_200336 [Bisporella sp. PMI_857]|nr:hypothetical protein B0O99DRAFT_200336 [Bisporella sp. PMI_857]
MAQKDRESTLEEKPTERRHRTKAEKEASRAHKSSRSSRTKSIDPDTGEVVKSSRRHRTSSLRDKDSSSQKSSSMADLVPELSRTASTPGATSRSSLPYPSFNKAHSREAVNSREDFRTPVKDIYTPDPTDVGLDEKLKSKSTDNVTSKAANVTKDGRPPSPPETEVSQPRKGTPSRMTKLQEEIEIETRPSSRNSLSGKPRTDKDDKSKLSTKSKSSNASTALKSPRTQPHESLESTYTSYSMDSGESNLTSVAPKKTVPPNIDTYSSPDSAQDSSPRTPTQTPQFPPPSVDEIKPAPSPFIHFDIQGAASSEFNSPQPPPPPPPPTVPVDAPRVDYLLQNGGLPRPAPKTLISVTPAFPSYHNPNRGPAPLASEIERIFGPYFSVLDQYETVMRKNGSMAVATGYRSVARRLLDRLENVFNRDLSSEGCVCVMCHDPDYEMHEGSRGLGWGEVLEWVSGRRELPMWPAFDFATLGVKTSEDLAGLGISENRSNNGPVRPGSPVKIDPDIAEEYREHYLKQTQKTKAAVNKWLSSCPETAATPPQEVDDETLSFAILTHLDQYDRPIFNALISGSTVLQPASRAPTPFRKPRPEFMIKTVGSLQRLYRLQKPPRDPEAAIYLLKNPHIHNLIATLSGINLHEWEILTSGRFDGFLWSGTDSENPSPAVSRGPTPSNAIPPRGPMSPAFRQANLSRNQGPFSPMRSQTFSPSMGSTGGPSRGPTPFNYRQPVSNDEEAEIQALGEIEREIYKGMEMLEDAFEELHRKAEMVRREMRERGLALSMSLNSRRESNPDILASSTPGLPSAGLGLGYERPSWADGASEVGTEMVWDDDDSQNELFPDGMCSNSSCSCIL